MAEGTPDDNEKTEQPTERKLEETHKKGDVPKSQEVVLFTGLLSVFLVVTFMGAGMASDMADYFALLIERAGTMNADAATLPSFLDAIGSKLIAIVIVPMIAIVVGNVMGNIIQHRPVWSLDPLKPKLNRVSPLAGFKRLFSSQSVMQLVKSIFKLVIIGTVMVIVLLSMVEQMPWLVDLPPSQLPEMLTDIGLEILGGVLAILLIIAGIDLIYQRYTWFEKQKMSLKEIKDEIKSSEGDPELRARLRQIRAERGRRRMMQRVPDAAVIINNPTHISIALEYHPGTPAPICVAKGADAIAMRIREVAREHGIPMVENKPLARALNDTVEIDDYIPVEHYKAVAEVISYVMTRKRAGHS